MENTFSADASADCSQLNCSARFWMGVKGEIEFRDVWFSYVPGEWVLQGVSFHVDARP